jgi:two-component system chemotaxis response regulator CheB
VLSGGLDDGAAGLLTIAKRGGACLVQDFEDALHASMPRAAASVVPDALMLPAAQMGKVLQELVSTPATGAEDPTPTLEMETRMADLDPEAMHEEQRPGRPSGFACPDCHGVLFELDDEPILRFRCRVGHAWSSESLVAQQSADLEAALWMALRSLEEKAALSRTLGSRALDRGHDLASSNFDTEAEEAMHAAELLRSLIERLDEGLDPGGSARGARPAP